MSFLHVSHLHNSGQITAFDSEMDVEYSFIVFIIYVSIYQPANWS